MNGATLVWKVRIPIFQGFLERHNPIRNKGFRPVSKPLKVNQEPPIPKLPFPSFLEKEMDGSFEPSIPSHEARVELALNTNTFPVEDEDPIAFLEVMFCSHEE